jgi:hypothetical protein
MVKLGQARRQPSRSGDRVDLGARHAARKRLAVSDRSLAVTVGLFAIVCGGQTVLGGHLALLGGLRALARGTPAGPCGADDDLSAGDHPHAGVAIGRGIALRHRGITRIRGLIARVCSGVACLSARVALLGGTETRQRAEAALAGAAIANVSVGERLLALRPAQSRRTALPRSLDRAVGGNHGSIA